MAQITNNLGIYLWENGTSFFGEWKNDLIEGEGIFFLPPKTFIHGTFVKNKLHGPAYIRTRKLLFSFIFHRSFVFEGFWQSGVPEGEIFATDIGTNALMVGKFVKGQLANLSHSQEAKLNGNFKIC